MSALVVPHGRRLDDIDLVRILTVVAVIAVHALGTFTTEPEPGATAAFLLVGFTRLVFFALTALLAVRWALARAAPDWPGFWKKRIPLVAVPLVVWTAVYTGTTYVSGFDLFGWATTTVADVAKGGGSYHLYFLGVTIQMYALLPLIVLLVKRSRGHHRLVFAAAFLVQLALYASYHLIPGFSSSTKDFFERLLIVYACAVVGGALLADHLTAFTAFVRRARRWIVLAVLVVGVCVVVTAVVQVDRTQDFRWSSHAVQPVTVVWALVVFLGLWTLGAAWSDRTAPDAPSVRLVRYLVDRSFGVFLVHPAVLTLTKKLAELAGVHLSLPLMPLVVLTTFAVSLLITEALLRAFPTIPLVGRVRRRHSSP